MIAWHKASLCLGCVLAVGLTLFVRWPVAAQEQAPGRKLAFLVGVKSYDHAELKDLEFPENDVKEMADVLKREGFTVRLMSTAAAPTDKEHFPDADNIRRQLIARCKAPPSATWSWSDWLATDCSRSTRRKVTSARTTPIRASTMAKSPIRKRCSPSGKSSRRSGTAASARSCFWSTPAGTTPRCAAAAAAPGRSRLTSPRYPDRRECC